MCNGPVFLIAIAAPLWATEKAADSQLEVLAPPIEHPCSLTFLPDGANLVTERPDRLRVPASDGVPPIPVAGLPEVPEVFASAPDGSLEVLLAEDFKDPSILFVWFAYGNADENHTRTVRARFDGREPLEATPIFSTQSPKAHDDDFGDLMAWMADSTLSLGTVDGFRAGPQNMQSHLRNPEGSLLVPALAEGSVRRVPMLDGGAPGQQDALFEDRGQRIRDLRTGPVGALYLVTDEPDGILPNVAPPRASG